MVVLIFNGLACDYAKCYNVSHYKPVLTARKIFLKIPHNGNIFLVLEREPFVPSKLG